MSTLDKVTDRGGNSFIVHNVDGHFIPAFTVGEDNNYRAHLDELKGMKMREDDVLVVGYAKSGTHWLWEAASMLIAGNTEYRPQIKESQFLEANEVSKLDALTSPRILNTHFHFRYLPSEVLSKKTKIVYLLRNPKDVAVSMYNHLSGMQMNEWRYDGKWEDFFELNIEGQIWNGSWFDSVLDWEKTFTQHPEIPVCTILYELMKQDPVANIVRLSEFLGLDRSLEFCQQVADACDFKKLRKADTLKSENYLRDLWKSESKGFYRKGQVGDWKNWFTVAQNERFDTHYAETMKDSKLTFRFE